MIFRGNILMGTGDAGWSENYYLSFANYTDAMAALQSICTARMALSTNEVKVRVLRISDVAVKGDSYLQPATTPAGTYVAAGVNIQDPAVALQVNAYNATHTAWTHWFVRGLPLDQLKSGEPFSLKDAANLVAPWPANLTAYKTAVMNNAVLYSKKPGPGFTAFAISTTGHNQFLVIRKPGRPFGLRRGRRVIV